ncbi:MAG: EamA family transporter, partial [Candidatus Rokuibacteriota bacterium]
MTPTDVCLTLLVVVIWGVAFIATKIGLASFSPPELATLRFVIASLPALFLARPVVSWPLLGAIGLTLFAGQFLFQFFGIAHGMPPGLASIVVQTQALFTILFAALVLRERPTRRQLAGTATAFAGLALIAATVGGDLTALGLGLTAVSAISWGIGNVLVKRLPPVEMLNL